MKKLLLVVSGLFIFISSIYAQENITITTYYPSPYGSYRNLSVSNALTVGPISADTFWGAGASVPGAVAFSGGGAMILLIDRNATSYTPTIPGSGYAWYDQAGIMRLYTFVNGDIVHINSAGFITQNVSPAHTNGCYMMSYGSNSGRTQCPFGTVDASISSALGTTGGYFYCCS